MNDGWETASLEDVGISRAAITKFIQMLIDRPITSVSSQQDHGVLIARHGKLVLEEYFHGEHRDKAHDTRSASKSVAADLIGAAMYSGVPIKTSVPVYQVMNGGEFPADLEPRRRALTLEHLLTMSSGLDCDDNDPSSPGYEDRMWEQSEDFYKWTMNLKMVRQPGEKGVYCSASPNLASGVLYRIAKKSGPVLFQNLLAEPLQIKRYYLPISPQGQYTTTGGARFLPRDFMKLAQVHLNGGTWKGRRVFTAEWSKRATTALSALSPYKLNYGYLWWIIEYPYEGRTIRAYFASGNGGQVAMAVPDLDLVLGFYGGNYTDVGGRTAREVYVPKYILPAVMNNLRKSE
jgi:CubicO group peptidase (beta-lactamase class C family)